jgi:Flp pilus assembly protein TadG
MIGNMRNKFWLFSLFSKLGKDRLASSPRLLARLLRDEDGSYLIYGITMLPILIGVAGLGTEASLLLYNHRTLQSAADAAVYSAAISYSFDQNLTKATTQAKAVVASYGLTLGTGNNQANVSTPTVTANYAGSQNTAITLSVSQPQSAIFSGSYGFSALSNNVSATAIIAGLGGPPVPGGGGNCVLALGNTSTGANAPDAIQLQGNATVNAPGCGLFSNSNDCSRGSYSESLGGNASITAGSLGSAGCMDIFGNAHVNLPDGVTCNSGNSTACTQHDGAVSNPLAGTPLPTTSSPGNCTATTTVDSSGAVNASGTLCPGVYSHGLNVTGSGSGLTVTLQPGIYILSCSSSTCPTSQGTSSMLIVKNATLTDSLDANGNGVTLVFDCSTCSASQWPNNGMLVAATGNNSVAVTLTAGANGFVMMGGSDMPLSPPVVFDTHSNPSVCMTGTVYVPNGVFQWGGTPSTGCSSTCLTLIVNTLSLYGNSNFGASGCRTGGVASGGGGAGIPIGINVVTLVD